LRFPLCLCAAQLTVLLIRLIVFMGGAERRLSPPRRECSFRVASARPQNRQFRLKNLMSDRLLEREGPAPGAGLFFSAYFYLESSSTMERRHGCPEESKVGIRQGFTVSLGTGSTRQRLRPFRRLRNAPSRIALRLERSSPCRRHSLHGLCREPEVVHRQNLAESLGFQLSCHPLQKILGNINRPSPPVGGDLRRLAV